MLSSKKGKTIDCTLPLGGFGISRFALDHFLYEKAKIEGCSFLQDQVTNVHFSQDELLVDTNISGQLRSKLVIGAYGKRSGIDTRLNRSYISKKSPWLAVKAHYRGSFPDDLVALHNFPGGYCGVSKVEDDIINLCYLVNYESFKPHRNISEHREQVLCSNPHLKHILEDSDMLFEEPMSISQVSFARKEKVHDHVLMIGDTAGLIHPLCGNGMSMAIHAAGICVNLVIKYLEGHIGSRKLLEQSYVEQWNKHFKTRMETGKLLSGILLKPTRAEFVMNVLVKFPGLFAKFIGATPSFFTVTLTF
ncbi:MAG: FAD-dependent oxidoreductase [Pedobacter sp.]|nr:MAG: FAD-dependent oxidoreductase [Pedobacter sp.]